MRAGELVSVGTLAFAGDRAWHSGEIIICGGDPHDWATLSMFVSEDSEVGIETCTTDITRHVVWAP